VQPACPGRWPGHQERSLRYFVTKLPDTTSSRTGSLPSRAEIWSTIRYLDPELRRGTGDLLAVMALFWVILAMCGTYLCLHLGQ
jgi:hypothetical protein